ncbi:trypsin-like [Ranitomeya variabilis]|uniref:trypsin-like n=1 Tax=Ranitomeya variabilis TaxID=490064 RepID=UPI004056931E
MKSLVFIAFLVAGVFCRPNEDDKIINGYTCYKNSVPYQVSLRVAGRHYCGGALIEDGWVLTSAQCYQNNIQVVLGEHDISTQEGTEMSIDVYRIFMHPEFDEHTLDNDIMLIKLARRISLTSYVRTVSLSSLCAGAATTCLVSGWGNTLPSDAYYPSYTLQCLESPTVSASDCSKYYPGRLTHNMFCAGRVGKFTTCKGDEGGPLVCQGQLQGIVSWGNQCDAQRNNPWVYTKVCNYIYWIQDIISRN